MSSILVVEDDRSTRQLLTEMLIRRLKAGRTAGTDFVDPVSQRRFGESPMGAT